MSGANSAPTQVNTAPGNTITNSELIGYLGNIRADLDLQSRKLGNISSLLMHYHDMMFVQSDMLREILDLFKDQLHQNPPPSPMAAHNENQQSVNQEVDQEPAVPDVEDQEIDLPGVENQAAEPEANLDNGHAS